MKRTVVFYRTAHGKCPVEDLLNALPGKVAQKIAWVLTLLEDLDFVPATYFTKLPGTDEIWECRISLASNAYRILCFFSSESSVVLTNGFVKQTKKTPRSEIERAEASRKDFIKRRIRDERH
jgi:phage-related protein